MGELAQAHRSALARDWLKSSCENGGPLLEQQGSGAGARGEGLAGPRRAPDPAPVPPDLLSQAAANRAKFAIKSYTISVSRPRGRPTWTAPVGLAGGARDPAGQWAPIRVPIVSPPICVCVCVAPRRGRARRLACMSGKRAT